MKKNIIVGAFLIISITYSIITLLSNHSNKKTNKKQVYLNSCISNYKSPNLTEKQKTNMCDCSHDYLYKKYGNLIYTKDFVVSKKEDSLAIIECMLTTLDIDTISSEAILHEMHYKATKESVN